MRWLAILGILIAAMPAAAVERTAEIRLRHISADELQTLLVPPEPEPPASLLGRPVNRLTGAGMVGEFAPPHWPVQDYPDPPSEEHLLPPGVAAWHVDPQSNTVRISGTPEGIKQFKALVQLADVPPIRVRMTVRLFRASDADLPLIDPDLVPKRDWSDIFIGMASLGPNDWGFCPLSLRHVEQLRKLPSEPDVEFTVPNNRPVNLRIPVPGEPSPRLRAVVPQFNADESVSFQLPRVASRDEAAGSQALHTSSGRIAIKQGLLVRPRGSEWTAVITPIEVVRPKAWRPRPVNRP